MLDRTENGWFSEDEIFEENMKTMRKQKAEHKHTSKIYRPIYQQILFQVPFSSCTDLNTVQGEFKNALLTNLSLILELQFAQYP